MEVLDLSISDQRPIEWRMEEIPYIERRTIKVVNRKLAGAGRCEYSGVASSSRVEDFLEGMENANK